MPPSRKRASNSTEPNLEPPKKRVRQKRLGFLQAIKDAPIEIVYEIFVFLEPYDILRLARSSKDLRAMLMSESSSPIWRQARKNLELPDPPENMNEPQFASLVFEPVCTFCRSSGIQRIQWEILARVCSKCLRNPTLFLDRNLNKFYPHLPFGLSNSFERAVPLVFGSNARKTQRFYLASVALGYARELDEMKIRFSGTSVEWEKMCKSWVESKKDIRKREHEKNMQYYTWDDLRHRTKQEEKQTVRHKRRDLIIEKLTALGWGEEIEKSGDQFRKHKLVDMSTPLSTRAWSRMEPELIQFLTDSKTQRLLREQEIHLFHLGYLFMVAYSKHAEKRDGLLPPPIEVAMSPPFLPIFRDTTIGKVMSKSDFDSAFELLPEITEQWIKLRQQDLLEILREHKPDAAESDIFLATSVFRCKAISKAERTCNVALTYPRVLCHECTTSIYPKISKREKPKDRGLENVDWEVVLCSSPWRKESIEFHPAGSANVESVMKVCGVDPAVATADTLDLLDPLVECVSCFDVHYGRRVMHWQWTLNHEIRKNHQHGFKTEDLTKEDVKSVLFEERSHHRELRHVYCRYCEHHGCFDPMKDHLKEKHGIEDVGSKDFREPYRSRREQGGYGPEPVWIGAMSTH